MKCAGILLLSCSIAGPAKNGTIVHFVDGSVGEDTLGVTSRVLVSSLGHVHHLLGVVESPPEAVGRWVCLYFANDLGVFVSSYTVDPLLVRHANRLI